MIGDQREEVAAVSRPGADDERRRPTDGVPLDRLGTVLIPPQARVGARPGGPATESATEPEPQPAPAPAVLQLGRVRPRTAQQSGPVPVPVAAAQQSGPGPEPGESYPAAGEPHPAPGWQPAPSAEPSDGRRGGTQPPRPPRPSRRWHRPVGRGAAKREHESTLELIRTPIRSSYRIAVISLRGGAGRTSTALPLGATLAAERADRVIALDADPDASGRWGRPETGRSLGDLLAALPSLAGYMDVRAFTVPTPSGLEVLAGDRDSAVSASMTGQDYRQVMELLGRQYPVIITDAGTGLLPDLMSGVLDCADQLILATTSSAAGAGRADTTIDWLQSHGYGELVQRAVTVISSVPETRQFIRTEDLVAHFGTRTRGVVVIPSDEHLAAGADLDLQRLQPRTRRAYLGLAALVVRGVSQL